MPRKQKINSTKIEESKLVENMGYRESINLKELVSTLDHYAKTVKANYRIVAMRKNKGVAPAIIEQALDAMLDASNQLGYLHNSLIDAVHEIREELKNKP